MDREPALAPTPRVNCLKILLTRTSLKKPTTERQSEGSDLSWAGIRSLILTVPVPPWMIIHLPVPEPNQPVDFLSSYRWMSGYVENLRD